jgi:large subunit ribosomal protein L5
MSTLKKRYDQHVKKQMMEKYSYGNVMEVPKLLKIVLNRGMGEATTNSKAVEASMEQLLAISGQKPIATKAKKSISNFKLRENQIIGCKVTLRSDKMFDFLTKLINIALPKIRDFRGVPLNSFDGKGNYTLGIKEDSIFPEVHLEKLDRVRGYDITFVTSAKNDKEAFDLLKFMGLPFRK